MSIRKVVGTLGEQSAWSGLQRERSNSWSQMVTVALCDTGPREMDGWVERYFFFFPSHLLFQITNIPLRCIVSLSLSLF